MGQRILVLLLILTACGPSTIVSVESCTTTQTETGATISCPDGTTSTWENTHTVEYVPATPVCFEVTCEKHGKEYEVFVEDCQ